MIGVEGNLQRGWTLHLPLSDDFRGATRGTLLIALPFCSHYNFGAIPPEKAAAYILTFRLPSVGELNLSYAPLILVNEDNSIFKLFLEIVNLPKFDYILEGSDAMVDEPKMGDEQLGKDYTLDEGEDQQNFNEGLQIYLNCALF